MKYSSAIAAVFCCVALLCIASAKEIGTGVNGTIPSNGTNNDTVQCAGLNDEKKALQGYIAAIIAVVFFGSMFVPVKKVDSGDGIFFQWIMCVAIWICGLITQLVVSYHPNNNNLLNETVSVPFQPLAMLGGFFWTTGNLFCIPVIKCIGLGLGMLIWGTLNCVGGWASGRFGLFGLKASPPASEVKNYAGVLLCIVGVATFLFVKSEGKKAKSSKTSQPSETDRLLRPKQIQYENGYEYSSTEPTVADTDESWVDKLSPKGKKIAGVLMAILAGLLFSVNFDPVTYLQESDCHNPQNGLDYVFSHFSGILLTSTSYLIIYCFIKKNRPQIIAEAILPGMLVGAFWAIADGSWFIANANLTQTISFPIVATAPGIISALWGVLVFAEIRGLKNLVIFCFACSLIIGGTILTALSK